MLPLAIELAVSFNIKSPLAVIINPFKAPTDVIFGWSAVVIVPTKPLLAYTSRKPTISEPLSVGISVSTNAP